ncbi:MAG TPA: hypothetical protein VMN60_12705 [Longimicrobiales bacterium]|nr:hypothetical protein [Longimicrobiales bacterium]
MPQESAEELRFVGNVAPAFPLAVLESVRTHDRPEEALEDEDFTVSMSRRLGMTGMVGIQIHRYETTQRAGGTVRLDEVMGLIRLVLRRADAEPILHETGQRLARHYFRRTPHLWQRVLHRAPNKLGLSSTRRAAQRALHAIHAGDDIQIIKPLTVRITNCSSARLDNAGTGCTMIAGLLEELLLLYTGQQRTVTHTDCITRGGRVCEWQAVMD